jgi:hypothetical protein
MPARATAFLTLLALQAPALASPASAQVVIHDVTGEVQFRDLTFKLPGPGWLRVTSTDQPAPADLIRFGRGDPLHSRELLIATSEAPSTLSNPEVVAFHVQAEKKALEGRPVQDYQNSTRTIAGASYTSSSWRVVQDGRGIVADVTDVVWVPSDFQGRGRYYFAEMLDAHSPSMSPAPLDDLDALVASFQTQELGGVLFVDKPDDPAAPRLPEISNGNGISGYVDGEYSMQTLPDGPSSWLVRPGAPGTHSHALTAVDVHLVGGDDPSQIVYVGCRWTVSGDTNSGYRLGIQPLRGLFSLQRMDKGSVTQLVGWRNSDAIHPGLDANHLELLCAGNTISAAINGTPLAIVRDATYLEGLTMLEVFGQGGPMEARFSGLTISAH